MVILYLVVTCEENIARDTGQDDGGPEIIGYICFFYVSETWRGRVGGWGEGNIVHGKSC